MLKNVIVNKIPNAKVSHGFSPEALGIKTPATKDPKIIFALSARKLEIIFICSDDNIL